MALNSLGIDKDPSKTRVVVAMSGGVDSSVVAALMHEQGYDVVGLTMQLYDHGEALMKKGACCAGQDIYDARRVADQLGFPHYVLDYESRFQDAVINDFADSYLRGETPIPCIRCNQTVKFRDMLATAEELEGDVLVTGHYVQRLEGAHGSELHRAVDPGKDQSYFLFATTQAQLNKLRFPLGGQSKEETRRQAERFGLAVADKPDSQDICFVPDGDYASLVARLRPGALEPGEIVDLDGKVLGAHQGIVGYTIGQRRGLNIGGSAEPLYVVRLEPASNRVIVGPKSALARSLVYVKELNWLGPELTAEGEGLAVTVKLRSAQAPQPALIRALSAKTPDRAVIELLEPAFGIAPGQAAVVYVGERVLGGGWIEGAERIAAG
jgi:tRNA-specific 2-thiouridylase